MRIRIKSDVPLSKETQIALSDFAYGSAWFDLDGGFRSGVDPERRQAVELVVTGRLPDGVTASPLTAPIWHLGPDPIPEGSFLLLRDDRGGLHDHRSCTQHIGTRHVFGALFRDESGTVWAARKSDGDGEIAADWPLEQVSAHTHPTVEAGFGRILDSLPAMGEFQLTNEIPARVAWIPWWSGFGSNPKEGVSNPAEDAVLRDLLDQARAFHETGTVHPDPAPTPGPKVMVLDTTAQEQELLVTPDPSSFPLVRIDAVAHVGTLDPARRAVANRFSLEAFCLSVSVDPDTWRGIARCGGAPDWTLSRPGALWFDACSLSDGQEAEIINWAVSEGLAERMTLWRAWRYDDEADDWGYMILPDEASAIAEAEEDWEEGGPDEGPAVEQFDGVRLTPAGMAALERWADPHHALGGLVILFADRVLAPALPDLVGVWWDELDDPLSLSCARGGVLPSRFPLLEVREGWEPEGPEEEQLAP